MAPPRTTRSVKWITGALLALAIVGGLFVLLRPDQWRYYTDGYSIRQPGQGANLRYILWEEPLPLSGQVGDLPDNYEPTVSADGRTMIFARGRATKNADLYLSRREGDRWSEPRALEAINTPFDELGPELSRDGQFLLFYSNRGGGQGGYDLWISQWDGSRWSEPINPGEPLNSPFNEYDPALEPGGDRLLFASNRPRRTLSPAEQAAWRATLRESPHPQDYDLYSAMLASTAPEDVTHRSPLRLVFSAVNPVTALNTEFNEGQAAFSPRGDFLYFSSNRRGGAGGFDLYRCRVLNGETMSPENLGQPVNGPADEMDPALEAEGYRLLFSSNRQDPGQGEFQLYHTVSREVVARTDLSALMNWLKWLERYRWWILGLLLSLAVLLWMLSQFLEAEQRRRLNLIQRCLLASVGLHVLFAFLLSLWVLSEAAYRAVVEPSMEVALNEGALARERLALEIREKITDLPSAQIEFTPEQQVDQAPIPDIQPVKLEPLPEIAPVKAELFVVEAPMSKPFEPLPERLEALHRERFHDLPQPTPVLATITLETPKPIQTPEPQANAPAPEPSDLKPVPVGEPDRTPVEATAQPEPEVSRADHPLLAQVERSAADPTPAFRLSSPKVDLPKLDQPVASIPSIAMETRQPRELASPAAPPQPPDIASNLAVSVSLPVPSNKPVNLAANAPTNAMPKTEKPILAEIRPLASLPAEPELRFNRELVANKMPAFALDNPIRFQVPRQLESPYLLRDPRMRERVIDSLGGSKETEAAIRRALDWFTRHQEPDGHWSVARFKGVQGHEPAGTGLALLCFLGWGAKHNEAGPHQETVAKAVQWLASRVREDGRCVGSELDKDKVGYMYDQGIVTIALAEAHGVSKDPALKPPVRRMLDFIIRAQNKQTGGWRYFPGDTGDTSVFGWQVMALKSAELAGFEVPRETIERAKRWLEVVGGGEHGGLYGYQDKQTRPPMAAEGMFCQQLLGRPANEPRMLETANYLRVNLPSHSDINYYYWYYGCLAMYQHQGPIWEEWNQRMRPIFLAKQRHGGEPDGSWDAEGDRANRTGRLVVTAMATLSLEVYYRYLPLYQSFPQAAAAIRPSGQ